MKIQFHFLQIDDVPDALMHQVFTYDNPNIVSTAEKTASYWLAQARAAVEAKAHRALNTKKAKNVIMFLGDGMSHQTIGNIQKIFLNVNFYTFYNSN